MRATNVFRLLVTYFVTLGLLTNCVKSADEKAAREERGQLATQQSQVAAQADELKSRQARLEASQSELDKKLADLEKSKTDWDNDRSTREQQLTDLSQSILAKTAELNKIKDELAELNKKIGEEKRSIETAREALISERQSVQANLEAQKAAFEKASQDEKDSIQARVSELESSLNALKEKESALEKREVGVEKTEREVKTREEQQKALQDSLVRRQEEFSKAVEDTRLLFSKQGLGDVLKGVEEGKNFQFLVSLEGRGNHSAIEKYREEIKSLNADGPTKHFSLTKLSETAVGSDRASKAIKGVSFVDDQFVVMTDVQKVRSLRERVFNEIRTVSPNVPTNQQTRLFVVVRPITKVRFGLELVLTGSKALGFEDRKSDIVLKLNSIRPADSKAHLIGQADLSNPSTYIFKSADAAGRCAQFNAVCLQQIVDEKLLDDEYSFRSGSERGNVTSVASGREFLSETLAASAAQMRADSDLFGSSLNLVGMTYDTITDSSRVGIDSENIKRLAELKVGNGAVKKLAGLLFGMGDERAPIIDAIRLKYRITLVDSINVGGNHLDTWKYLDAGTIMNTPVYELGHSNDEIEIQLPIADLKEARTNFGDLNLKDFTYSAAPPTPPNNGPLNFAANKAYNKSLDAYKKGKVVAMRKKYKDRLIENAGEQTVLRKILSPEDGTGK